MIVFIYYLIMIIYMISLILRMNRQNISNYKFKNYDRKTPDGPYTNLIGLSLKEIRKNNIFHKYIQEIDSSNMIYKRRWGDLPLWGEAIHYIFGYEIYINDKNIKYYHESHKRQIN